MLKWFPEQWNKSIFLFFLLDTWVWSVLLSSYSLSLEWLNPDMFDLSVSRVPKSLVMSNNMYVFMFSKRVFQPGTKDLTWHIVNIMVWVFCCIVHKSAGFAGRGITMGNQIVKTQRHFLPFVHTSRQMSGLDLTVWALNSKGKSQRTRMELVKWKEKWGWGEMGRGRACVEWTGRVPVTTVRAWGQGSLAATISCIRTPIGLERCGVGYSSDIWGTFPF